jgi:exonuclease SbcD
MVTRLLAVGDQHLGAGADLGLKPGARLAEQEAVWEWTLQQARDQHVDAVLHAGDVFQHRRPDPEALLAFERPLVRHQALGGPRVLCINGNHDVSSLDSGCALDVFAEAGLVELARTPRVVLVDGGARVALLPWAPTSRLAANWDGPRDELNEHTAALLIDAARELYETAVVERERDCVKLAIDRGPIVLLTHFSISGTSLPSGLDVGQLREPVLPQDELLAIGYDAVIAGHIHRPQMIGDRGLYVGSPQPLNFGEVDGQPRGAWILELDSNGLRTLEHLPAPSRRFVNLDVGPPHLCVYDTADITGAYVKVRIRGTEREVAAADVSAIKARLETDGAYRVFVETVVERETRARDETVDDSLSEHEALTRWLAAQNGRVDHAVAARALQRAAGYFEQVSS